jgi:hypothetical protein
MRRWFSISSYWVRPADLAAQRFDNTVFTFESH